MHIEQAIYGGHDEGGYRFLGRTAGFRDEWLPDAERLCTGFGDRPAGAWCPLAVFARPFGRDHVAVVQVADVGADDAGRPGALAFRLLLVPARLYAGVESDPFLISDRFPPDWSARGDLPTLEWVGGAPPHRTVADLKRVLDVAPDVTASLLGGVQVLIDGGRLVFARPAPATELVRGLWALLPASSRGEMWPATYAFGNAHGFHVLAVPDAKAPGLEGHTDGDEAGGYPEGRYEYAIQKAVEDEDQAALDGLLSRSSRGQMIRLGLILLAVLVVGMVVMRIPFGPREEEAPPGKKEKTEKKSEAAPAKGAGKPLALPEVKDLPRLSEEQRRDFAARLAKLAAKLGAAAPAGTDDEALGNALGEIDRRADALLGDRRPKQQLGDLAKLGPARRQLMALAWKYGVAEYADTGLNAVELLERLEKRLFAKEGP